VASSPPSSPTQRRSETIGSFGLPHLHFERTSSTNSRARELAAAGAPHGTIVTAAAQTSGRGRQGRTWTAPAGEALLYSAILRSDSEAPLLSLSTALAVCAAAESLRPDVECALKWPNDVWLGGRKLAGVLIEARPQDGWAVVGVGLNLSIARDEFPIDLRETAVSLFDSDADIAQPGSPSTPLVAAAVLSHHLDHFSTASAGRILAGWRERDALLGREVAWDRGSGVADGVDDRGRLIVIAPGGGRVALAAGEVHLDRA
jgi:BirA family transcriptional regulator, biotin operon repressor / biotin---[acetyl-CoA-carboxylase] ligase